MESEDVVYLIILLLSIGFGHIFRSLHCPVEKKIVATTIGIFITLLVSGYNIIHQLITTCFTIALIQICPKRFCHLVSFVVIFTYLLFFRICHHLGLPTPNGHSNAIQMMMTLKMVGICFEIHDTWKREGDLKKHDAHNIEEIRLAHKHESISPSPMDIFHYSFSYIGLMTGPYYKYKVYEDAIKGSHLQHGSGLDCFGATKKRFKVLPFYVGAFLISSSIFPLSFAKSKEIFEDYSFLYRVWYMTPTFFNFRMRIYSGFILSECVCLMAGVGAYPTACHSRPGKGPTNFLPLQQEKEGKQEYDFKTVYNIDEWGSEFSPTVRGGMRAWNMTVQFWLATNVYKRLNLVKPIKETLTMLTSAFWHGMHSGYYLSLMTVPLILVVEDYYEKKVRRNLSSANQKVYDFFAWILKMQQFSYMSMAFLLLRIDATLHYWRSIGFLFHGGIAIQHAIAQFINLIIGKVNKKLEKSARTSITTDATYTVTKTRKVDSTT